MTRNQSNDEISDNPNLRVEYSPELQFSISCSEVEGHTSGVECRCEVTCRVLHPGGHFEYVSGGLLFDIEGSESFASFLEALRQLQWGEASCAVLKSVGEEFVLTLETADRIFRRVHINIAAREYVAEIRGFATAQFDVESEYDLYVNRLLEAVVTFVRDLRRLSRSVRKT